MAQIATYNYQFHGGPTGYRDERAIVRLFGPDRVTIAYIHFVLTGKPIPPNKQADPVGIYYNQGEVFLHTGDEPIGESGVSPADARQITLSSPEWPNRQSRSCASVSTV